MIQRHGINYTHKGWFGLCPVYFAGLDTEAPAIDPRHRLATPLMILSEWMYGGIFFIAGLMNPSLNRRGR